MKYLVLLTYMITELTHTHCQCIPDPNVKPGPNDPPFPQLPPSFMTRIEATIKDKKKTISVQEYVDYDNNRAVLKTTTGGQYSTKLFDYKNDQILNIDENKHCSITNLSQSQDTRMLGGTTKVGNVTHVFSSNGVLQFMQKSGQVYQGTIFVRGVLTDRWSTCIIWPKLNSTFTLDYFFTTKNWNTAIGFPQIPVRAVVTGTQTHADGTKYQFEHYYEYVDFRIDIDDYTVFEIPKGVYCPGRKSSRPVPSIPSSVHYRAEITSKDSSEIGFYDAWYDSDLNLVRNDYKPDKNNPQRNIYDFTTGIMYVTDIVTGACIISPIPSSQVLVNIGPNGEKLVNPDSFFLLDANYSYTGQRLARGIQCDVFTAQRLFPYRGIWYNSTVDYYFLSSYYKELPSDGTTAPTDIPFRLEATLKVPGMDDLVLMYNFLDFDTAKRSISDFDISGCYKNMKSLRFQLRLPGPFRQQDTDLLMLQAQRVLPSIMNVTKIRLQNIQVDFDPSTVYLTTTLLDVAPDYAKFELVTTKQLAAGTIISRKDIDQSVDFITTWQGCATVCIQSYDFICNSFDFCPNITTSCHIYKDRRAHTPPCLAYSVYQRTVNGISNQETAVMDAYGYLQTAINKKALHLQTFDPNGIVTDYYAVETEILAGVLEPQGIMPSLSGQFSFRDEITVPYLKRVVERDVWYDYNFKLARYDLVTTGAPYYTDNPLVHIHDYNSGVAYVIDSGQQNCTIKQISKNLFGQKQNGYYSMNSPLDVFDMNRTYTFVGQKSVRGMTCNLFEATVDNFKLFMTDPDVYNSTFQYYFMKDDWTENSDSNYGPTRAQPVRLDISSAQKGLYLTFNYYNWNNHDPDLSNFNIVPCYTGDQQKHFAIVFKGQYHPYLDANSKFFKLQVHNKLAEMTNASVIRFQQPQIDYGLTNVYVIMTVVDPAPQIDGVPYLFEPDTDSIIYTLNDNIYRGLLNISVPQPDGSIYSFNATAITDNILRNDGRPLSSKTMSHFKVIKNKSQKSLSGYLSGISVDKCAESCLDELVFDCYSFVYCASTGMCFMAKTYAKQRPDLMYDRPNCDLYYRSYIDKFTMMPGLTSPVKSSQKSPAATTEVCAQQCINDPTAACKSFLFCEISQTCSLLQTHNLDITKTTINTNFDKCLFYSRSYLNDFKKKSRSTMKFTQVLDIEAVSVDQCARLCIQTEAFSCNSFAFCGNSTTCRLTPSHPVSGMRTIATDYCDLYSRIYYTPTPTIITTTTPTISSKVTNSGKQSTSASVPPLPPSSAGPISMTTGKQTNSATKLNQSSTSNGYSPGAMAGVAIGLLVIGIICGGGLVILFFKRKKDNPMEYFNMNYSDSSREDNKGK